MSYYTHTLYILSDYTRIVPMEEYNETDFMIFQS